MSSVVHLHVGVPKTGTTYLQAMMHRNRGLLRRHGTLYPGLRSELHFLAARDLLEALGPYGDALQRQHGAWERLTRAVRRFDGTAVVSHEILADATPAQIRRAVTSFGDAEVRVVVTARDLGRQVPAIWQEDVKNRRAVPYEDYLSTSFRTKRGRRRRTPFWRSQNLLAVCRRWAEAVGPQAVTLVTVPQPGAAPDELWHRFRTATGLPDVAYQAPPAEANKSLRADEAELLRRLNLHLDDLSWEDYISVVKYRLAETLMVGLSDGPRIGVPREYQPPVERASMRLVAALERDGYPVVGDLAELRPRFTADGVTPTSVSDADLLAVSLDLVAALTRHAPLSPQAALRATPSYVRDVFAIGAESLRTWR